MASTLQLSLTIAIVLLNAYSLGANAVERFVNYQSWPLLAEAPFAAYHRAQQPYILGFLVAPAVLSLVLQVIYIFDHPAMVSAAIVWTMAASTVAGFVITVAIQIPIHKRLNVEGYSAQLVSRLLNTDWLRKAADAVRILATIALLYAITPR